MQRLEVYDQGEDLEEVPRTPRLDVSMARRQQDNKNPSGELDYVYHDLQESRL